MNRDAISAWEYVVTTMRHCKREAMNDYDFVRLVWGLQLTYPEELEVVLDLKTEGGYHG